MTEPEAVYQALEALRTPFQTDEYDLHRLVMDCLQRAGLPCTHEAMLSTGGRIDLLCGATGIEIKKGKPDRARLTAQLTRYAAAPELTALIAVTERHVDLPARLSGKPVRSLCLNRLWGIAL